MAHKKPCAKYQYVVTPSGPKILPVDEPSCKDEESPADYNAGGYLPIKVNDAFKNNRYRVVRKLGWGHFSTVWLVKDSCTQQHSALKVVKSAGRYAETARDEIMLLSRVQSFSPNHPGRCHIVSFLDSFTHQGPESSHICIVFEPLGENLLALIERHKKRGVPRALVRVIAKQILLGLEYLHDECDLVHTDIKPENILICIPEIEDHIQCELSRSPSATSRRVGVPLPTKTRSGVTIPQLQQRPRRQVQIFDSQPLVSPSRSTARSGFSHSTHPTGVSERNSFNGSYGSPIKFSNPSATAFNSSASKVPSGLSASSILDTRNSQVANDSNGKISQPEPQTKTVTDSPASTSSSSSSIVSIVASTTTGSSNISTPPTSLPQSFIAGGLPNIMVSVDLESHLSSLHQCNPKISERYKSRIPSIPLDPKGKAREYEIGNVPQSPSHTTDCGISSNTGHLRSHSGTSSSSSGFWKDPGAAAPAPAVVVSAVVGAAGADGDYLELSNTTVQEVIQGPGSGDDTAEKTSRDPRPKSLLHGVHRIITSNLFLHDHSSVAPGKQCFKTHASGPSLLTQTAPPRHNPSQETALAPSASRPFSLRQPSHLSAHMHRQRSPSCKCTDPEHKHRTMTDSHRKDAKCRLQQDGGLWTIANRSPVKPAAPDASTSTTPTLSPPPPAPPTTPSDDNRFVHGMLNMESSRAVPCKERNHSNGNEEPVLAASPPISPPPIFIKIADLGNATPSSKHYTEDIQTRQYRAPEAILGRSDWDVRTDIWSVACLIFELSTAEYLFDPQGQGELFTKDDDHMAQIIELMGDFPLEVKMGGKYSRELFDHIGALRYIRTLKFWPLKRVMIEKYLYTEAEATSFCNFLEPMLTVDMRLRAHARDMKDHAWLEACETDELVTEW